MARPGRLERPDIHVELPPALVEHADRLLLGTGLDAVDALRIAASQLEPPAELRGLAVALRAGWEASEDAG